MAKEETQGAISFDPSTFSSGRWDGGRGVVLAEPPPHFEYKGITTKQGPATVINAHFMIEDQDGNQHDTRWQVGYADGTYGMVIRESNDPDSDEAERGPSVFARNPGSRVQLQANSEFGQLHASLQLNGYPSAELGKGDLTVFIGLNAEWVKYERTKGDKYPILVVGDLLEGKGKSKGAAAAASAKPKAAAKPAADDDDEDEAPAAKGKSKGAADPEAVALEIALAALNKVVEDVEARGGDEDDIAEAKALGTTVGDVVRTANKQLKGDPGMRKLVLDLVGGDPAEKGSWITSQDEFKYKKKTNSIVLVED